ncbi:tRNA preQ1(34) S-adenosylmethionine ribosyltransferase-isomerase QueA [Patescibacteria group bacterium]|nr:tRNA preQ1(34) S-adenosylmethionine ribosyltransferase-isomerase QueA [Patescibacteria group bacterium]
MLTKDFFFELPSKNIANKPAVPRDSSKMMVLDRGSSSIKNRIFNELPDILTDEYLIVLNKTRVFPAKLKAKIKDKECELLLLKREDKNKWQCMVKPGKKFKIDTLFQIDGKCEKIDAKVVKILEDGTRLIDFSIEENDDLDKWIESNGYPPFPPYIKNAQAEMTDYQTVYAKNTGSIAAPTAGLHFTDDVFTKLAEKGIQKHFVTLHVGRGTFLPVKSVDVIDHVMHSEWYEMDEETAKALNEAKDAGKKILAVGTTSVRVLESNFRDGKFHPEQNDTKIFIYPGYKFKAVDALLTNFHLPESTLLMLVSAFAGKDFVMKAYKQAVKEDYRFYSFGDSMLIL